MEGPNMSMAGRVALLTGAGRGIGLSIAKALAWAGCAVAIQDIDLAVAEAEAGRIVAAGGRAVALGGDVQDLGLPARAVSCVAEKLGGLHVLVNNAAIQQPQPWLEMTAEDIENQIRADLVAPLLFCQRAVPIFRRQRWGRILNIGSVQGKHANPGMLAYSMSKAALSHQTAALAKDLAKDGITVNLLAPGWFDTYRNRGDFVAPDDREKKGKWIPMGRIGRPEDCAGLALLLCSDAAEYITGQTIYIDGGLSAR